MIRVTWDEFKTFLDARGLPAHESPSEDDQIVLEAHDGPIARYCRVHTESAEYTDYVANYRANANSSLTDSNGAPLARAKVTKTGWFYQEHGVELVTSKLGSVTNNDKDGTDLGFATIKFYNSSDVELTAGTQTELDNNCVKTVVTWEPDYDYQIIGSQFYQSVAPTNDVRLYVIAVPDYPAPSGSIPFVTGGINLKHMGTGRILQVDGRSAKEMKYADPVPGTNKFELVFVHSTGDQCAVQVIVELFKP